MEVSLEDIKPESFDSSILEQQLGENRSCSTATEFAIGDDSALLTSLPKAEMKLRKLEETKLLTDNNENSLSVDTLIEMLSSNEPNTKLPPTASEVKIEFVPPLSAASSLSSPSSSSSACSSKVGVTSPGPSPESVTVLQASPKKFPSPYHVNGGKPMISDMNKKMKQVSKRQPRAVYQSQISDNAIGIKLCIKKSVNSSKSLPSLNSKSPRKRSRKSKAKGVHESDSDEAYVKRRKKSSAVNINNNNHTKTPFEEPVEQSGWGTRMPKEILFEVSRHGRFRERTNVA